jgi:hypothetical protein
LMSIVLLLLSLGFIVCCCLGAFRFCPGMKRSVFGTPARALMMVCPPCPLPCQISCVVLMNIRPFRGSW